MKDTTSLGLRIAEGDLDAAGAMLHTGRHLYAAFQAHQSCEESLKAWFRNAAPCRPPFIHDLEALAVRAGLDEPSLARRLARLSGYYIASRNPKDWDRLRAATTEAIASALVQTAREVLAWSRQQTTSTGSSEPMPPPSSDT